MVIEKRKTGLFCGKLEKNDKRMIVSGVCIRDNNEDNSFLICDKKGKIHNIKVKLFIPFPIIRSNLSDFCDACERLINCEEALNYNKSVLRGFDEMSEENVFLPFADFSVIEAEREKLETEVESQERQLLVLKNELRSCYKGK